MLNFSHVTGYANPTTFAWVFSLVLSNPLIPAVTCDKLGLPETQMQVLQVTCPRDGECDFSQGPDMQTIISSHTLRESPFQAYWASFDGTASLSLTSRQCHCCNSCEKALRNEWELREIRSPARPAQWSFLTELIEGLLLQSIDFSVKRIKSSILMSLCPSFAKGVLSDKRPIEEADIRLAITSIFLVLKERERIVIFQLLNTYKGTLKLLQ